MSLTPLGSDASLPPDPGGGWSHEIVTLRDAVAVPPVVSAMVQPAGVLAADGTPCPHAVTWRGPRPTMTAPSPPAGAVPRLPGRHLYAGQLWAHFGHFLCESLPRLWALGHAGSLDGIVFLPKRPGRVEALSAWQTEMFDLFDLGLPVRVLDRPTQVEELVIPGQGFGIGPMFAGTALFRAFIRDRFARGIAPDGRPRLYLSRSALGGAEGGILTEPRIEAAMEQADYAVFHPQKHAIAAQVAAYRAARSVVGPDGSAFHMLAFADPSPKDIAVILRRSSGVPDGIATHIAAFTGRAPRMIDALVADWVPEGTGRANRNAFGQVDFARLQAALTEGGFIPAGAPWPAPRFREIVAEAKGRESLKDGIRLVRKLRPDTRARRKADGPAVGAPS
jgi:capsular polysaccharide biosynthesis protein